MPGPRTPKGKPQRRPTAPPAPPRRQAGPLAMNPSYGFRPKAPMEETQRTPLPTREDKTETVDEEGFEGYENEGTTYVQEDHINDNLIQEGSHDDDSDSSVEIGEIPTLALICPLLHSKVVLDPENNVVIGRSPSVTITLPAKKVSRKHAEIRFDGHGYSIHDLGSTNGTYVNGGRIHRRRRLRGGMKIDIGAFTFEVLELATADEDVDVNDYEDDSMETVLDISADLIGQLEDVSVAEVVQFIETTGKTGRLIFFDSTSNGVVWIEKGTVMHAEFGPEYGLKAALLLFGKKEGRFEFRRSVVSCPRTVMKPTTYLLMEAARMVDEANLENTEFE